ncbi:hypothetical protein ACS0TY_017783 [Phlomoides rotata]
MATLLESCRVAPPPETVAEQSLPLTFFDITWLFFHPICQILFYEFPNCSKPYFLHELVPKLKQSLSLSLKHFFPLAGKIVYPLKPEEKPVIRYRAGDSVSVAFFESSDDFDDLVGNHGRDADKFYGFIPQMAPIIQESDHKLLHLLALQVTLFPGRGLCIGSAVHHSVGDARSVVGFIKSWALINKLGGEEGFLISEHESLPLHDRSLISYPPELDSFYWARIKKIPLPSPSFALPTNRVRATYVFSQPEIKNLKDLVIARLPGLGHVSSFVVTAAYVWSCLARAVLAGEGEGSGDGDEIEFFSFGVDLRARINPPVPSNYFGNCISYGLPKISHQELVGEEGFFLGARAIVEEIKNRVINNENILGDAENWFTEMSSAVKKSHLSISGSERFNLYDADFGWGKARKLEIISIDKEKYAVSLCKSRVEGGLEFGLSLPKVEMDDFEALFHDVIKGE